MKTSVERSYYMAKYVCNICDWEYDEEQGVPSLGIEPGTKWEDLPEEFVCPLCKQGKAVFTKI